MRLLKIPIFALLSCLAASESLESTCLGAVGLMAKIESECPKLCNKDEAQDGLPKCQDGQKERNPQTCGVSKCSAFLASITPQMVREVLTSCLFVNLLDAHHNHTHSCLQVEDAASKGLPTLARN